MDYLFRLQRQATVLTIGVSLLFLVRAWREAELYGAQEVIFGLWFIVALATQLVAHRPGVWIAGLLAQVLLAIVLVLKEQMDNIY
jgi:ABC-type thiamin/hydroxymethylpyrimidine transport system permease subunit